MADDGTVRGRDRDVCLSFEYRGYHVTVRSDGRIEIAALDAENA